MSFKAIVSGIRRGTVFVERDGDRSYVMKATGKPLVVPFEGQRKQATWRGRGKDGDIVEFCITEGLEHYGPHIYTE
jgi:hypothetical protein